MDLLTWLLLVCGFGFAICLQLLVKTTGDLSQGSVYEAPAILGTPSKTAAASKGAHKAFALMTVPPRFHFGSESVQAARLANESEGIETESTSSTTASPTELPSLRASLNVRSPGNRLLRI